MSPVESAMTLAMEERTRTVIARLRALAAKERAEAEADPECFEEPEGAIALEMAAKALAKEFLGSSGVKP